MTLPASRLRRLFVFGLLTAAPALGFIATAQAVPSPDEQKVIDRLMEHVEAKSAMVFIRNDAEHDAAGAVKHMRAKLDHFKARIVTAEDFIELCATRSEMTGEPYKVREGKGPLREAAAFMREELKRVRAELHKAG